MTHTISDIYGDRMTLSLAGTILAAANTCISILTSRRKSLVHADLFDTKIAAVHKALNHWQEMKEQYTQYVKTTRLYKGANAGLNGYWTILDLSKDSEYAQCSDRNGSLKWIKLSNL